MIIISLEIVFISIQKENKKILAFCDNKRDVFEAYFFIFSWAVKDEYM